ncbi:MAG TPA: NAD(P)H-hydrate dehydratase [Actinomycetota bacterium]|nr:NAD(P)H-hydrate dehydratase [Actinomycetota bacterium]
MKPVLTPQQAVELDRATQAAGVDADTLMERAGRGVARAVLDLLGGAYGRRVVVVCGKGNNGGDGYVAARILARAGMHVTVHAVEPVGELREPAGANARRLASQTDVSVRPFSAARLSADLGHADVAIDAVFGTGFRGQPEDEWADAIDELNRSDVPVVAVDIPSGVEGETGAVHGTAVVADLTVTFGAAKVGAVLLPGAELAGDVRVVDIGFPERLVEARAWLTEPSDVAAVWPSRAADSHKRASGVLVVVAGSRGMTGAPALIAEAAGRTGTGLLIVAAPASALDGVRATMTEAVTVPLDETDDGVVDEAAVPTILDALERADALAIGPGLTTAAAAAVRAVIRESPVPVVVDADGLNAFTGDAAALADRRSEAVLTPHLGEFGRLTGSKASDVDADRLGHVRRLASTSRAVALLKGTRTVVAEPSGDVRVNPTGSRVLATAGSGDVLTGVIGGLLARGVPAYEAAASAAYVHGVAGTLAGRTTGEGTLARDVIAALPDAIARTTGGER